VRRNVVVYRERRWVEVAIFTTLVMSSCGGHSGDGVASTTPDDATQPTQNLPTEPTVTTTVGVSLTEIEEMLSRGYFDEAREQLELLVLNMPAGWQPMQRAGDVVRFAAWDEEELAAFAASGEGQGARIDWIAPSFSRALYFMAFIAVEERNAGEALTYIQRALRLEPDQPQILGEAGLIYHALGEHEEALRHFERAMTSRSWARPRDVARAQRGAATVLVELGHLSEATDLLNRSLENDPGNPNAMQELEYIRQLQSGEVVPEDSSLQIRPSQ
jgi:tetratricopeptide (TPR) repeat protein